MGQFTNTIAKDIYDDKGHFKSMSTSNETAKKENINYSKQDSLKGIADYN